MTLMKVPLYARCGIREALAIGLNGKAAHVFRDPVGARYRDSLVVTRDDVLSNMATPRVQLAVRGIF